MGYSNKFSNKLNDLLNINYEVEKIYLEIFKSISNEAMKRFFKERQIKRNEFSAELRNEISKHNIAPQSVNVLSKYYNQDQVNNRKKDFSDNKDYLLFEVLKLKKESIDKYNELLRENSLPLSLCRALVKQRDNIQDTMRVLDRENILIA
jgi:uncharacterized protein YdaT